LAAIDDIGLDQRGVPRRDPHESAVLDRVAGDPASVPATERQGTSKNIPLTRIPKRSLNPEGRTTYSTMPSAYCALR
jgi:hypothetical protein